MLNICWGINCLIVKLTSLSDSWPKIRREINQQKVIIHYISIIVHTSTQIHIHLSTHLNMLCMYVKVHAYLLYPSLEAAKTLFPPRPGATHHEVI